MKVISVLGGVVKQRVICTVFYSGRLAACFSSPPSGEGRVVEKMCPHRAVPLACKKREGEEKVEVTGDHEQDWNRRCKHLEATQNRKTKEPSYPKKSLWRSKEKALL